MVPASEPDIGGVSAASGLAVGELAATVALEQPAASATASSQIIAKRELESFGIYTASPV
jgi:hypothetical protein